MSVYINDLAEFLPNQPVSNDQMEEILGMVNQVPSRTRRIILRNNKIKNRHYAIDPETGEATHTNAQLGAEAIRSLRPYDNFSVDDIECLCCGSSSTDLIVPGQASMVHGELGGNPCEVVSTAGICVSGMSALKFAWMNVAMGLSKNAVACGSELPSSYTRSRMCCEISPDKISQLDAQPVLSFEADFIRWMLSDGAGAAFLSDQPREDAPSLRIDWIDIQSYANEMETCMFAGGTKQEDGTIKGWREYDSPAEALKDNALMLKQDVKLLNEEIMRYTVEKALTTVKEKYNLETENIDWFLPHYSSDYFRLRVKDNIDKVGLPIPLEKWYSNLTDKGNTGSASMYIMLAGIFHSGKLKKGDRILCYIPESGRFSVCYMHLTVC